MKIGKRNFRQFFKALFAKQHYIAFINSFIFYENPFNCLGRYFFGTGEYPARIILRTPTVKIKPEIYSYYDMLTVNEIFCRQDYKVSNNIKVVIDLGSNIGISALYFLSRNNFSKVYLFEPDPKNIIKLEKNLKNYEDRYVLNECAVSNKDGVERFGREVTGRVGGLSRETDDYIDVKCRHVNSVILEILESEKKIDVLKIDIEGEELTVLQAIDKELLKKINLIYFEIDHTIKIDQSFSFYPDLFEQKRYGETIILQRKQK